MLSILVRKYFYYLFYLIIKSSECLIKTLCIRNTAKTMYRNIIKILVHKAILVHSTIKQEHGEEFQENKVRIRKHIVILFWHLFNFKCFKSKIWLNLL